MSQTENYPPVGEAPGKRQQVADMFDAIAPRYDFLNRVLSLGIDQRWRRKAVSLLADVQPKRILDVATGTGDLAIEALRLNPDQVVGVDIARQMLEVGQEKLVRLGLDDRISLQYGDASRLPFSDHQFEGALVAFGVRNFEDLELGLAQMRRVLKPGGRMVVLEFSQPTVFPVKQVYGWYSRHVLPRIGSAISGDDGAYKYLPDSIAAFPSGEDFLSVMRSVGFKQARDVRLTFGVASLYTGLA